MKRLTIFIFALCLLGARSFSAPPEKGEPLAKDDANLSLRHEVLAAIAKGLGWLQKQQQSDGSFINPINPAISHDHPALTALPLLAFAHEPNGRSATDFAEVLQKGYAYLRTQVQPDGGIYAKGLSNYNTSVSLMALLGSGDPKDESLLANARAFVVGQQAKGLVKSELDGGFGYGPTGASPRRQHPDLDNTLAALEALRAYKKARPQVEIAAGKDLNWQAAIDFVSRCQNLRATNAQDWASDDAQNKGGFVYFPGSTNSDTIDLPDGKKALRSYGSMSYAGLLSLIYADLSPADPRVTAALEWLEKNYTVAENPGMRRQGLFYYYQLAAKCLATAKIHELTGADGKKINWPRDLGLALINQQNGDGSWVNDTGRFMEKDPVLVTSYSVLTLEIIYAQL